MALPRAAERRVEAGHRTRDGSDLDRRGAGAARIARGYAADADAALRRQRDRPARVCGRSGVADARGACGQLRPGAAGGEGGSDDCASA